MHTRGPTLRLEDQEFKASLGYMRLSQKQQKTKQNKAKQKNRSKPNQTKQVRVLQSLVKDRHEHLDLGW